MLGVWTKGGSGIDNGAGPEGGGGMPEFIPEFDIVLIFIPEPDFIALGKLALVGVSNIGEEASDEGTSNSLAPVDGFLWNEGG